MAMRLSAANVKAPPEGSTFSGSGMRLSSAEGGVAVFAEPGIVLQLGSRATQSRTAKAGRADLLSLIIRVSFEGAFHSREPGAQATVRVRARQGATDRNRDCLGALEPATMAMRRLPMRIEPAADEVHLILTFDEAQLLSRALERASFIDTPVSEQARIQEFCARALEALSAVR
jgi:hypothetical protein